MKKVLFQVKLLDCPSCGKKIEDCLSEIHGVISTKAFSGFGKVRIDFNEDEVTVVQLEILINELGYVVVSKKI